MDRTRILNLGRCLTVAAAMGLCGWWALASVSAAPLGLDPTLTVVPDVLGGDLLVEYNAGSQQFSLAGSASDFDPDGNGYHNVTDGGTPPFALAGTLTLTATINNLGELVAGTLVIEGAVPDLAIGYGTLLTADLTAFGFQAGDFDVFEFSLDVTGGALAATYGSAGGVIIDAGDSEFADSFGADFSNDGLGVASVRAVIPEPATGLLVMLALGGAVAGLRRGRGAPTA